MQALPETITPEVVSSDLICRHCCAGIFIWYLVY